MIKTQLAGAKKDTSKIIFPALFRHIHENIIVLFTDPTSGTCMEGKDLYTLGMHTTSWARCSDSRKWTPLNPGDVVTLTVE